MAVESMAHAHINLTRHDVMVKDVEGIRWLKPVCVDCGADAPMGRCEKHAFEGLAEGGAR